MKRLCQLAILLIVLTTTAFATITVSKYQSAFGHYLTGAWTSSGAKQCLTQVDGEVFKSWTLSNLSGTWTAKIEGSADGGKTYNTLITYTQASTTPIGGEAQNYYTDFCVEVSVCSSCTVNATISTGYQKMNPYK